MVGFNERRSRVLRNYSLQTPAHSRASPRSRRIAMCSRWLLRPMRDCGLDSIWSKARDTTVPHDTFWITSRGLIEEAAPRRFPG